MQNIKDIPAKEIVPGVTGHYAHGDKHSFGFVELKAGSFVPEHHHLHEQITYVLEGQLEMNIGGEKQVLTTGNYYVIKSNVIHSALAITNCKIIDTFSPVREEYKQS